MDFAENLNRICKEKGTTPTAICKKLGVSTSKVAAWNKGSLPKADMMVALARELECSVMDFFADGVSMSSLDDDEMDIIRVYRSLDRRGKHAFMSTVFEYEAIRDKTKNTAAVG